MAHLAAVMSKACRTVGPVAGSTWCPTPPAIALQCRRTAPPTRFYSTAGHTPGAAHGSPGPSAPPSPEGFDRADSHGPPPVALLAREAERDGGADALQFSPLQRRGLGGAGAVLAVGGLGGLAWLHWPLVSLSGLCAGALGCGGALMALAANGKLPNPKQDQSSKAKPLLELKLLNNGHRLKGELEALAKLEAPKALPKDVEQALSAADEASRQARQAVAEDRQKALLAEAETAIAAGADGHAVRRRFRPRLFVFDFNASASGMLRPQSLEGALELLRTQVDFILESASEHDAALLRLTSPGGPVAPYGLAAAQLLRLRDAGVGLTVCVDTVAASGGYMMACTADRIVAAPFAMVGSIGVIAGVPNVHKVLERNDVEFTQVTAGKFKRTVNVLTPNTEEGLAKFRQDIDSIHQAFKDHVRRGRPDLDVEGVATGEAWLGTAALDRGLVDRLGTSDEEIRCRVAEGFAAVEITRAKAKKDGLARLLEGLGGAGGGVVEAAVLRVEQTARALWRRAMGHSAAHVRAEAPGLCDSH